MIDAMRSSWPIFQNAYAFSSRPRRERRRRFRQAMTGIRLPG
jgi:hypothetical protein